MLIVNFQIKKRMDVGTGNPIVARLSMELFDIIQMASLDEAKKDEIKSACFDRVKFLVEADDGQDDRGRKTDRNGRSSSTGPWRSHRNPDLILKVLVHLSNMLSRPFKNRGTRDPACGYPANNIPRLRSKNKRFLRPCRRRVRNAPSP